MKCEVPNKKLSKSWSIMTGLKTTVQLLGENNHFKKIAKELLKRPTILANFINRRNIVVCI